MYQTKFQKKKKETKTQNQKGKHTVGDILGRNDYSFFFSFSDYSLGSHRVFQKDKSVIQLNLQKNGEVPGKLSRKVRFS